MRRVEQVSLIGHTHNVRRLCPLRRDSHLGTSMVLGSAVWLRGIVDGHWSTISSGQNAIRSGMIRAPNWNRVDDLAGVSVVRRYNDQGVGMLLRIFQSNCDRFIKSYGLADLAAWIFRMVLFIDRRAFHLQEECTQPSSDGGKDKSIQTQGTLVEYPTSLAANGSETSRDIGRP